MTTTSVEGTTTTVVTSEATTAAPGSLTKCSTVKFIDLRKIIYDRYLTLKKIKLYYITN